MMTSRPVPLHDRAPWVPPALAEVVDAMLVHDRNARIPSATAVMQRLIEADPTVSPDGSGKHTVIVPRFAAAVDATSDTETFKRAVPDSFDAFDSVTKTHRCVVVQEQWKPFGPAAEIAASITETIFDELDAPVERVTGEDVPMPYARNLELLATPHEEQIMNAVRRVSYKS